VVRAEALSLGVLLQAPDAIRADKAALAVFDELPADAFGVGLYRAIFSAVQAAGGVREAGADWVARVAEEAGEDLASAVNELAVTPLPHDRPETMGAYAGSVMGKVFDGHLTKRIGELRGAMKRAGEGTDDASRIFGEIIALEAKRRSLRAD
jgi:DNA primase